MIKNSNVGIGQKGEVNEFVQAGAGTGKTYYIINTLLGRLLSGELKIAQVLAITFTEKAANEMRNRLVSALLAASQDKPIVELGNKIAQDIFQGLEPVSVRNNARQALDEIDSSFIGTIHSFCVRLIKEFPREAGIAAGAEADEGGYFEDMFNQFWSRWISDEMSKTSDKWTYILKNVSLSNLKKLAYELCDFKLQDRILLDVSTRENSRRRGRDLILGRLAEFESILKEYGGLLTPAVRDNAEFYLDILREVLQKTPDEIRRKLETEDHRKIDKKDVAKLPQDIGNRLRELVKFTRSLKHLDDDLVSRVLYALTLFVLDFRRSYLTRGRVTFSAMLSLALNLLRVREVRDRLKVRFKLVLVDEFQDTDPIQYEIVLSLAERKGSFAADWSKMKLEPGKLIVVGDPNQSIYSFRGADLDAYKMVGEHILKNGTLQTLSTNYRSCQNIVNVVNSFFKRLLPKPYTELICGNLDFCRDKTDCVELVEIGPDDKTHDKSRLEASYIARRIRELKSSGHHLRDIAILLRKLTHAHDYLEVLRSAGIDYVIEGDKFFYRTPEVAELYNFLAAVADPLDKIALVGVLRSPIVGLTDREIYELKMQNGLSFFKTQGVSPRIARFFTFLQELHCMALTRPIHEVLRTIFDRTMLLPNCYMGYRREIAVSNLLKLYQQAIEMSQRPEMTLRTFLSEIDRRIAEEDEGEDPVADEDVEAVRIMSIHKAKGLQFDTVFVPGLSEGIGEDHMDPVEGNWSHDIYGFACGDTHDLGMIAYKEHQHKVGEEESRRLLYVVMTRARHRLILINSPRAQNREGESFTNMIEKTFELLAQHEKEMVRLSTVTPHDIDFARISRVDSAEFDHQAQSKRWEIIKESAVQAQLPRMVSATSLLEESYKRIRVLPTEEDGDVLPYASFVGSLCHLVLATEIGTRDLRQITREQAQIVGGSGAEREIICNEAYEILAKYLSSDLYKHLQSLRVVGREVPFLLEEKGQIISGRIDVIFETGNEILIIDYKTDRSIDESGLVAEYKPQLEIYSRAIAKAFPNRKIKKALVWLPQAKLLEV